MKEEPVGVEGFEGELHFDLPHAGNAVEQNVRAASKLRGCHLEGCHLGTYCVFFVVIFLLVDIRCKSCLKLKYENIKLENYWIENLSESKSKLKFSCFLHLIIVVISRNCL